MKCFKNSQFLSHTITEFKVKQSRIWLSFFFWMVSSRNLIRFQSQYTSIQCVVNIFLFNDYVEQGFFHKRYYTLETLNLQKSWHSFITVTVRIKVNSAVAFDTFVIKESNPYACCLCISNQLATYSVFKNVPGTHLKSQHATGLIAERHCWKVNSLLGIIMKTSLICVL